MAIVVAPAVWEWLSGTQAFLYFFSTNYYCMRWAEIADCLLNIMQDGEQLLFPLRRARSSGFRLWWWLKTSFPSIGGTGMQVFMTKYIKIQAHWNVWRVAAILSVRSEETEAQKGWLTYFLRLHRTQGSRVWTWTTEPVLLPLWTEKRLGRSCPL